MKATKILFSHSFYYQLDQKQWRMKMPYPPLGTIYAASYLRKNKYDIALYDTNLLNHPRDIKNKIENYLPKYLVIYDDCFNYLTKMCLTNMREACFEMIKIAKSYGCKVIVSSSDSTDHYEKYIDNGADFILQGEAEQTLLELINNLEQDIPTDQIFGLVYKNILNQIKVNPKRNVLSNLDELPQPAWDLIDIEAYRNIWKLNNKFLTLNIATTRGCPYKCNWCAKPIYGNRYNAHSPEYIVEQIEFLTKKYNVFDFWMCDDIFGLKPGWVQRFDDLLKEKNIKISYFIQSRVDLLLKENTIEALASSGLREVWLGAESGSQKILDAMDKGITLDQIELATKLLKQYNIKVAYFLQFGYLNETLEDIKRTINMVRKNLPDLIGVSVSYPLPGTKFYDKVKDDLRLKQNWSDSDDFEMMFQGTFSSEYYRILQRYIHKIHRITLYNQQFIQSPFSFNAIKNKLKTLILKPLSFVDEFKMNQLVK
jgi:anaerobic magnesium-protoporphyrin IX monomethyl ester cyclase